MKLDSRQARYLWNQLCLKSIGVDAEGQEVQDVTTFGSVVTSHGLSLCPVKQEDRDAAASWLEGFAKALRAQP